MDNTGAASLLGICSLICFFITLARLIATTMFPSVCLSIPRDKIKGPATEIFQVFHTLSSAVLIHNQSNDVITLNAE